MSCSQFRQSVKAVTKKPGSKAKRRRTISPPLRLILSNRLPFDGVRPDLASQQLIASRCMEKIVRPQKNSKTRKCGNTRKPIPGFCGMRQSGAVFLCHVYPSAPPASFPSLATRYGPIARTSIRVLLKQSTASSGLQTIGSFSLKLVFRRTGVPVMRAKVRIKS